MAKSESNDNIDNDVLEAEVEVVEAAVAQTALSLKSVWIALSVLLFIVLAVSYWGYQQLREQQHAWLAADTRADESLSAQRQTLSELSAEMIAIQQQQNKQTALMKELAARDQLTQDDILQTWSMAEIHYLLDVANQRALLSHDVHGALTALKLADKRLENLSDYRLHPLRALIAEEVLALESLQALDVPGMAIQLQVMADAVSSLRVKKGPTQQSDILSFSSERPAEQPAWQVAVNDIWQQIRSLVVIRHDDSGEAAVLAPEQRYFLYQNVRLQIESARLSLLLGEQANFEQSLDTAMTWLMTYFVGQEVDAMLAKLTQLQSQSITMTIPDIAASLNWLEAYQP
jgi:uroporphyrin-3 C-methyltransferase